MAVTKAAFLALIDQRGEDDCWPWLGRLDRGYGVVYWRGREHRAHRVAVEVLTGKPLGARLGDHACHNRAAGCRGGVTCSHRRCCNPRHIDGVDTRTNLLRSPLTLASRNAVKSECDQGHPFTTENTYVRGDNGARVCRICARRRRREHARS